MAALVEEFEKARLPDLSYSSQQGYAHTIRQLREHFGSGRKLRSILQRHVEAFLASRKRRDGRPGELSSWTRARHLIHARAVFQAALDWAYVEINPFRASSRGNSPLRIRPKSRGWHHITPHEFTQLLAVAPDTRWRAMLWLLYGCGLRAGELYNLTLNRIDLGRRRVLIESRPATDGVPPFTVKGERQSRESKSRVVPIPLAAVPDIAEAMRRALPAGGFIALTPSRFAHVQTAWRLCRAGEPWGRHAEARPWQNRHMANKVRRDLANLAHKAGIELTAPLTLPTFRKSFAQNHADMGTPPRTLATLLGHANTRVTLERYNKVADANEHAAAEAMDRLFAQHTADQQAV